MSKVSWKGMFQLGKKERKKKGREKEKRERERERESSPEGGVLASN